MSVLLSEKVQIQINDAKFQANQNPEHDAGFYLFYWLLI